MKLDLTPAPLLGELIEDLENKLNTHKSVLTDCSEYASAEFVDGLVKDIEMLEEVLGRVVAQQELIDLKTNSICLN